MISITDTVIKDTASEFKELAACEGMGDGEGQYYNAILINSFVRVSVWCKGVTEERHLIPTWTWGWVVTEIFLEQVIWDSFFGMQNNCLVEIRSHHLKRSFI